MVSAASGVKSRAMVIRPSLATGWETTVDDLAQEVRMRFKMLGLPLPLTRRVPFSEVGHVRVVCRESWWSRAGGPWGNWQTILAFGVGSVNPPREPMPTKGWRYDLLMTRKYSRMIKVVTLKPSDDAYALAAQLRGKVGLPPEP